MTVVELWPETKISKAIIIMRQGIAEAMVEYGDALSPEQSMVEGGRFIPAGDLGRMQLEIASTQFAWQRSARVQSIERAIFQVCMTGISSTSFTSRCT
jgi:hypothetical protein